MARIVLILCLMLLTVNVQAHLVVKDAWVREAPPRARTLAMFLQLTNHDDKVAIISGASSAQFKKVELHETKFDNGMMRMRHVPELIMQPDEVVDFKPGGLHIMLMNPVKVLKAGDQVNIRFQLKDGKMKVVSALVRSKAPVSDVTVNSEMKHHQH